MRPSPLAFLSASMLCLGLSAAQPDWGSDLEAGKARAAREHRALVVYFTGSAWCPPCKLLHAELLPSPAFGDFARDKVLVVLDYPPLSGRTVEKIKADPALTKLMGIKDQFKVTGFPTMLLLGPDGLEQGRRIGFEKGKAPAAYLAELAK